MNTLFFLLAETTLFLDSAVKTITEFVNCYTYHLYLAEYYSDLIICNILFHTSNRQQKTATADISQLCCRESLLHQEQEPEALSSLFGE